MNPDFDNVLLGNTRCMAFFDRLERILSAMDLEYARAAQHYGFQCNGCPDNCCQTRFYHHTYLEYLYVTNGVNKLDSENQRLIISRAREICRKIAEADEKGKTFHRIERRYGKFRRVVTIPVPVDEEKITADYSEGVLKVNVPKSEKVKPKRIPVNKA